MPSTLSYVITYGTLDVAHFSRIKWQAKSECLSWRLMADSAVEMHAWCSANLNVAHEKELTSAHLQHKNVR